jgi:hypothetical protein
MEDTPFFPQMYSAPSSDPDDQSETMPPEEEWVEQSDPATEEFFQHYESFVGTPVDNPIAWQSQAFSGVKSPHGNQASPWIKVGAVGVVGVSGLMAADAVFFQQPEIKQADSPSQKTAVNPQQKASPSNTAKAYTTKPQEAVPDSATAEFSTLATDFDKVEIPKVVSPSIRAPLPGQVIGQESTIPDFAIVAASVDQSSMQPQMSKTSWSAKKPQKSPEKSATPSDSNQPVAATPSQPLAPASPATTPELPAQTLIPENSSTTPTAMSSQGQPMSQSVQPPQQALAPENSVMGAMAMPAQGQHLQAQPMGQYTQPQSQALAPENSSAVSTPMPPQMSPQVQQATRELEFRRQQTNIVSANIVSANSSAVSTPMPPQMSSQAQQATNQLMPQPQTVAPGAPGAPGDTSAVWTPMSSQIFPLDQRIGAEVQPKPSTTISSPEQSVAASTVQAKLNQQPSSPASNAGSEQSLSHAFGGKISNSLQQSIAGAQTIQDFMALSPKIPKDLHVAVVPLTSQAAIAVPTTEEFGQFQVFRFSKALYDKTWAMLTRTTNSTQPSPTNGFIDYQQRAIILPAS